MPTYYVTFPEHPGRRFKVESEQSLTEAEAYQFAKPQADALRSSQVQAEQSAKPFQVGDIRGAARDVAGGQTGAQRFMGAVGTGLQSVAQGIDELLPGRPLQRGAEVLSSTLNAYGVDTETPNTLDMTEANKGYVEGGGWQAQAGDIAGKIVPSLAVPANALGAAPGMVNLARHAPRVAQVLGTMLTAGGVAGATTPGSAGERAQSAGFAAVTSGILPAATMAVQKGRRAVTSAGRDLSRAEAIRDAIRRGNTADESAILQRIDDYLQNPTVYEGSRVGVNPTVGMLTENPSLMRIEQGSRSRAHDIFQNLDEANAAARWSAIESAAGTPRELFDLRNARSAATRILRERALRAARNSGQEFLPQLEREAVRAIGNKNATDAEVKAANYVLGRIRARSAELGGIDDPAVLYAIKKDIANTMKDYSSAEGAALRSAERLKNVFNQKIDDVLDSASGGEWSAYNNQYKSLSGPINSREAMAEIRDAIAKGLPTGSVPPVAGMKAGPATIARQADIHGYQRFGSQWRDQLSPEHRGLIDTLYRDLEKQAAVNLPPNRMGSPTAALLSSGDAAGDIGETLIRMGAGATGIPGVAQAAGAVTGAARQAISNASDRALANILQDPAALSDLILKARRAERILGATTQASRPARAIGDPWE